MHIKKTYIIILSLFFTASLFSQKVNPFEIKDRLTPEKIEGDSLQSEDNKVKETNNFEVMSEVSDIKEEISESDHSFVGNPFDVRITTAKKKENLNEAEREEATFSDLATLDDVQSHGNDRFLFWIIMFSFILLAIILSLDRWYISKLFKSIFNYNISNLLIREATGFNIILLSLLYLLFFSSASVFLYLTFKHFSNNSGIYFYLICLALIVGVYIMRHIAMWLMNWIFSGLHEILQYSYTIAIFNIVLGIILLAPVLLLAFSSNIMANFALIIGLAMIVGVYALRSFRGLLISFNYLIKNTFHFFLYLCAFEIVPLMFMYKLIADFV